MFAPRVLVLLGAVFVLSGHVACEDAAVPASIRPPALASYVQPAGLRPVALPGQSADAPSVMKSSPPLPGARMPMPDAPAIVVAPSVMNPAPQAPPGQRFMERAPQTMPQTVEPNDNEAFMGPLQMLLVGFAAGGAIGATITKKLMNNGTQHTGPGRAGVPAMMAGFGGGDATRDPEPRRKAPKSGWTLTLAGGERTLEDIYADRDKAKKAFDKSMGADGECDIKRTQKGWTTA